MSTFILEWVYSLQNMYEYMYCKVLMNFAKVHVIAMSIWNNFYDWDGQWRAIDHLNRKNTNNGFLFSKLIKEQMWSD